MWDKVTLFKYYQNNVALGLFQSDAQDTLSLYDVYVCGYHETPIAILMKYGFIFKKQTNKHPDKQTKK